MELELSDDQELLRATAARFIADECPLTKVRELIDSPAGLEPGYLRQAGELGWFALLVPAELGGGAVSDSGVADLAIVAEERGRGLQPGPFIPMNVVADLLARRGNEIQKAQVLGPLVVGDTVVTWVATDGRGNWNPGGGVHVVEEDGQLLLVGASGLVQEATSAEWLLVTAADGTGLTQFLVPSTAPGLSVAGRAAHDVTQRFGAVSFDRLRVEEHQVVGDRGGAAQDVERQLQIALVLVAAEMIGALDAVFELMRQYALDRIAFGRPIGSFQAVKHQIADMSLSLEAGKAVSAAATRALAEERPEALEIARIAKAWIGETGIDIVQGCFQIFGGIGYTWEHDQHLYLRRVTMGSLLYGQADHHREQICVAHGI